MRRAHDSVAPNNTCSITYNDLDTINKQRAPAQVIVSLATGAVVLHRLVEEIKCLHELVVALLLVSRITTIVEPTCRV